jgi:hypothetical protein
MSRLLLHVGLVAVILMVAESVPAADTKGDAKSSAPSSPITQFVKAGQLVGEVAKLEPSGKGHPEAKLTIRVSWYAPAGKGRGPAKEQHKDHVLLFADGPNVRTKQIPKKDPKPDGTPQFFTPAELRELKGDPNLPGYAKQLSDLAPGMMVEAHLLKDPKADKDHQDERLIHYVMIMDEKHQSAPMKRPGEK